ncbi:hypothetical protein V6N11_062398 [Hibiscus sabdariffa]|uniref:Serine aminopeptidase S33 domain-containing protein n=1 Tax=Hibiscus sabdariffa TaxID=183260 RepID=A0ABR2PSQ5_9ROSI
MEKSSLGLVSLQGDIILVNLAAALEKEGINVFRFDFAGQGESEGSSLFAEFDRQADDIRAVVQHFSGENRVIRKVDVCLTEQDLMNMLRADMREVCRKISKECRVLTVHGSVDKLNPVVDALAFAEVIRNHQLHIIEGADHRYTSHQTELVAAVVKFIKSALQQDKLARL